MSTYKLVYNLFFSECQLPFYFIIFFNYCRAWYVHQQHIEVDRGEEHAMRANLAEYKNKMRIDEYILPDPFTLEDGWLNEEDGMQYWPNVFVQDIQDFLQIKTPKEMFIRLKKDYKEGKAYRYKQLWTKGLLIVLNKIEINIG